MSDPHDYELTVTHVDTCLSCYVQDHCNGDDELLVGVAIDASTTYERLRDELIEEARGDEKIPEAITDAMVAAVVQDEFSTIVDLFKPFDPTLDAYQDDDSGEDCYAWFRFSWTNPADVEAVDDAPAAC